MSRLIQGPIYAFLWSFSQVKNVDCGMAPRLSFHHMVKGKDKCTMKLKAGERQWFRYQIWSPSYGGGKESRRAGLGRAWSFERTGGWLLDVHVWESTVLSRLRLLLCSIVSKCGFTVIFRYGIWSFMWFFFFLSNTQGFSISLFFTLEHYEIFFKTS